MRKILVGLVILLASGSGVGYWWFRTNYQIQITRIPRPPGPVKTAYDQGEFSLAAQLGIQTLESDPDNPGALLYVARSYSRLGQWEKAEGYFAQVPLTLREDFHLRAEGLERLGLWTESSMVWQECLRAHPDDGDSLQHMAIIRIREDRVEEATAFANRLTATDSHRLTGLVITGMLHYHKREYAPAAEAFQKAVELDPDLEGVPSQAALVYRWLADSLLKIGKPDKAEPYAKRSRDEDKTAECAWILGRIRRDLGDFGGAKDYWEESNALDPKDVRPMNDLGQYYLQMRDPENSVSWYQQALLLEPKNEDALYGISSAKRQIDARKKKSQGEGGEGKR